MWPLTSSTQGHIHCPQCSLRQRNCSSIFSSRFGDPQLRIHLVTAFRWQFKRPPSLPSIVCQGLSESLFVPSSDQHLVRSPVCQKVDCLCFFISKGKLQGMQSVCGAPNLQKRGRDSQHTLESQERSQTNVMFCFQKEREVLVR